MICRTRATRSWGGRIGRSGPARAADPADRHQRNPAWLSARPVIGRIPGPWRLGYSGLEGPDGFTDDTGAAADLALREIILFPQSEPSRRG
jgi:hypothetical protein